MTTVNDIHARVKQAFAAYADKLKVEDQPAGNRVMVSALPSGMPFFWSFVPAAHGGVELKRQMAHADTDSVITLSTSLYASLEAAVQGLADLVLKPAATPPPLSASVAA